MIPEAKQVQWEMVLRSVKITDEVRFTSSGKIRWLALTLGLIQPGEGRHGLLDILNVLYRSYQHNEWMTVKDIATALEREGKTGNEKTIYYHLQRLKELGIVSKKGKHYRLGEEGEPLYQTLEKIYKHKCEQLFNALKEVLR
jgi:predicted transcriptional regulator